MLRVLRRRFWALFWLSPPPRRKRPGRGQPPRRRVRLISIKPANYCGSGRPARSSSAEDAAYLDRAIAVRRANQAGRPGGESRAIFGKDKVGFKPLTEMTADDRYKGQDGGLYGGGKNTPPEAHRKAAEGGTGEDRAARCRGASRRSTATIVFVSISMSNATQEFSMFKQIADADPDKSPQLTIVDCAQGGQAMAEWVDPGAQPWAEAERRLAAASVTPEQVQVAWIKLANKGPQRRSAGARQEARKTTRWPSSRTPRPGSPTCASPISSAASMAATRRARSIPSRTPMSRLSRVAG